MAVSSSDDPLLAALARLDGLATAGAHQEEPAEARGGAEADDLAALIEQALAPRPRSRPERAPRPRPDRDLEARLADIEDRDAGIRAFVAFDPDLARREFDQLGGDEPLAGAMLGHKDILCTVDQPTTAGSNLLRHLTTSGEAVVVSRLRVAGAISAGKLATHEFASGVTGTVSAFPTPLNPRAPDRIPGGSSSGSAAAVAAGLVDIATGSDTGGSIRIPAACCGVVGFKPTRGRVPTAGVIPFSWTLDHVGPIALSVASVTAATEAMANPGPAGANARSGRLAFASRLLHGCTPVVAAATQQAAEQLESAGYAVEDLDLPPLWADAPAIAMAIFLAEGAAYHAPGLAGHRERYQPATLALLDRARHVTGRHYVQACRLREEFTRQMEAALAGFDALLLPALPCAAPRLGAETVDLPEGPTDVRAALTRFTRQSNLTGQPALVLPCESDEGVPIGVQLVGRRGCDLVMQEVGLHLEDLLGGPWKSAVVRG